MRHHEPRDLSLPDLTGSPFPRRSALLTVLNVVIGVGVAGPASAQAIEEGPYQFSSEAYFVATSTFTPYTFTSTTFVAEYRLNLEAPPAEADVVVWAASRVRGYTPTSAVSNLGSCPPGGGCVGPRCGDGEFDPEVEILTLGFEPGFEPEEGPGIDFVVFDTNAYAWSIPNDYFVRVRPQGGTWLTAHQFLAGSTRRFVRPLPEAGTYGALIAIELDFSVFGQPYGTVYEQVEILAGCPLMAHPEPDIIMAAAVERACEVDADCERTDPCLEATCFTGRCRYAAADPGTPCATGVCDGLGQPSCVECVDNTTCGLDTPVCDRERFVCVGCVDDGDCPDERCEPTAQVCVPCLEAADCPTDITDPCRQPACLPDRSCGLGGPQDDGTVCFDNGYCHGETAECVDCRLDEHCTDDNAPRCDIPRGDCVACLEDSDCPPPEDPCRQAVCGLDLRCAPRAIEGCVPDAGLADAALEDGGTADAGPAEADGGERIDGPDDPGCGCRSSERSPGGVPFLLFLAGLFLWIQFPRRTDANPTDAT